MTLYRCLLLLCLLLPHAAAASPGEWADWKDRYLAPDGRVVDTGNAGVSHSEGQGYGMLFAVEHDDRDAFERIWGWTRRHLSRPSDALLAWRFSPDASPVMRETNNATDGDIFVAWALARAGARWQAPEFTAQAHILARDILSCCVREIGRRTLMLPAAAGFVRRDGVVVNLSYYNFAALRALSRLHPSPRWAALERDGLALIAEARFGPWGLPPDWLLIPADGGRLRPDPERPPRFSWDALRIPLNYAWMRGELGQAPGVRAFWEDPRLIIRPPAWVNLHNGQVAPYRGHVGVVAVQAAMRRAMGEAASLPRVAEAPDYYGASMVLQARIMEVMPPEAPPHTPPPGPMPATAAPETGAIARISARVRAQLAEQPAEGILARLVRMGRPE